MAAKAVGIFRAQGLAISIVAAAAVAAGCGSDEGDAPQSGMAAGTAERLAAMSDGIADSLGSGDTCGAAAQADDLRAEISKANIPAELRSEAEAAADQLVNEVNCEAPAETTTLDEEGSGDEGDGGGEGEGRGEDEGSGESEPQGEGEGGNQESGVPPGHGGTPPGQVGKIKGGI